ncbi:aspartate aminotransferase family protein [Roseiterribacter gracilis]|uniref:Adenosylmethionine-8-amino-7-oxononanoate aminotransferase n=1 Tax=Roseiterribacter gracilis TaxID=2812848 RepID=A0A8S8XI50_9PROT|nr:adenosylmethionine-8-amino-7-oxononanoate aminotransferase [Rhodospirillales bacterium TMPK1]
MTHVFHRTPDVEYPAVASAVGLRITALDGRTYIDGASGAAVCGLGYGDAEIIDAIKQQLDEVAFVHSGSFTSRAVESLADELIAASEGDFAYAYFVSGGSEATETALKMTRQYFVARGDVGRHKVISRRNSYHGNTLGALSVSGNPGRRELYAPLLTPHVFAERCYPFRDQQDGESDGSYLARLITDLRARIEEAGPTNVMAFIAEPVVGASLGAVPAIAGYFRAVREICDAYGIMLILDEVMCGMGRTGSLFAYKQEGIVPDIVVLAKGLAAGYQPIGAVLVRDEIYRTIARSGVFQHGHTYMCHATAAAAARAVLRKVRRDRLDERAALAGVQFQARLTQRLGQHPMVGDIRGRGLFVGVELVEDRTDNAPIADGVAMASRFRRASLDAGLVSYPIGGFLDGQRGAHVLLAPALTASDDDLDEIIHRFGLALAAVQPA